MGTPNDQQGTAPVVAPASAPPPAAPSTSGTAFASDPPPKPCRSGCQIARSLLTGDSLKILAAVLLTVIISALFTMSLQLYSLGWPNRSIYTATPEDLGLNFQTVSFPTSDPNVTVAGWYIPAEQPTDRAILALHGYGSNKSEILPRVGFLARRYNLLLIDFRYFGETTGAPTTLGVEETVEAQASLEWLQNVGMRQVGLYGMSMGGGVAMMSLADSPLAQCAVVESPFADLRNIVSQSYSSFGFLADYAAEQTVHLARLYGVPVDDDHISSRIAGLDKPLLVIWPLDDKVVGSAHVETLQRALSGNKNVSYWFLPGKGYSDIADGHAERLSEFYARCFESGDAYDQPAR